MLENAIYSVISPEGCASILWRDPSKSLEAAKAMKLTANELFNMKIIDEIITEPIGGAHRNKGDVIFSVKQALSKYLEKFNKYTGEEIFEERKNKFLSIGNKQTSGIFYKESNWIKKNNFIQSLKETLFRFRKEIIIFIVLIVVLSLFVI